MMKRSHETIDQPTENVSEDISSQIDIDKKKSSKKRKVKSRKNNNNKSKRDNSFNDTVYDNDLYYAYYKVY